MLEKPPNNMQKQMNKKLILIVALALLAVFGLGLLVGAKFSPSKVAAPTASNQNCAGVSAPKLPEGMEVKTANGTVKKVSNGTITLQTNQGDPMATQGTNTLTIHTDSNTKIYQLVQKDQAQFQQEMADFQKKLTEQQATLKDQASSPVQSAPVIPPMMQEKKEISFNDLKEGQQLSITTNENIRSKAEFTASEIDVQVAPQSAAALPGQATPVPAPPALPANATAAPVSPTDGKVVVPPAPTAPLK